MEGSLRANGYAYVPYSPSIGALPQTPLKLGFYLSWCVSPALEWMILDRAANRESWEVRIYLLQ
jgi:hypothetical protein